VLLFTEIVFQNIEYFSFLYLVLFDEWNALVILRIFEQNAEQLKYILSLINKFKSIYIIFKYIFANHM
jgi:hypothetical protein